MNKEEVLCNCFRVTVGDIEDAIRDGATSIEDIQDMTSFGTACGVCLDEHEETLHKMLENN